MKKQLYFFLVYLLLFCATNLNAQNGKVLVFDGVNDYMSVADHSDLDIDAGENFTITCWVKTNVNADFYRIIAKRSGNGYEFFTGTSTNAGKFAVNMQTASGAVGTGYSTLSISNNSWHHLAMVLDATGTKNVKTYIDGVLAATGPTISGIPDFSNAVNLIIGASSTLSYKWTGQIDDIRFWGRALSPSQLQVEMTATIKGPAPDLLAAWNFENVSGVNVPDVSGNNHSGTLFGNPAIVDVNGNMQYNGTSLLQTQVPAGRGDTCQRILSVNVKTSGAANPLTLTELNFAMDGTTNLNDVTGIKIYYTGNNNRFNTNSLFATVLPGAGSIIATGTQALAEGNNYFWITYDLNANAVEGNLLDAKCNSIVVDGTTQPLTTNTVEGSSVILLAHKLLLNSGEGAPAYRIPAIVTANDGSLITAADKRNEGTGDLPADIDIAIRRSTDNGQTWSATQVIADLGNIGCSDPALVVDKASGKIICLFATNQGLFGSTPTNPIRIQMCTSMDNGVTWSAITDITNQIYGAGCNNPVTKNWHAAWVASGRAHQLRNGIIVAAIGVRQTSSSQIDNFMIYSRNGGVTWKPSTSKAENSGDEAKIVQLNNGKLMMSIRNPGTRRMNLSNKRGIWGTPYNQTDITDPNCNGDFVRYTSMLDGYNKNRLIQTIPFASTRQNVSVLISYDEGTSFPVQKTIYPGPSAYSSITMLPDGTLGMYYENQDDGVFQLYFARFSLNWVTNGADSYTPPNLKSNDAQTMAVAEKDYHYLEHNIVVYPNPAKHYTTVNAGGIKNAGIELANSTGMSIPVSYHKEGDVFRIKTSGLNNGIYFIKILDGGKIVSTKKLIIE